MRNVSQAPIGNEVRFVLNFTMRSLPDDLDRSIMALRLGFREKFHKALITTDFLFVYNFH